MRETSGRSCCVGQLTLLAWTATRPTHDDDDTANHLIECGTVCGTVCVYRVSGALIPNYYGSLTSARTDTGGCYATIVRRPKSHTGMLASSSLRTPTPPVGVCVRKRKGGLTVIPRIIGVIGPLSPCGVTGVTLGSDSSKESRASPLKRRNWRGGVPHCTAHWPSGRWRVATPHHVTNFRLYFVEER